MKRWLRQGRNRESRSAAPFIDCSVQANIIDGGTKEAAIEE
jgi:hypothetical protein